MTYQTMKYFSNPYVGGTYVAATLSYGLLRKGLEMKNATISYYDREKRENTRIPVLLCDKAIVTAVSGVAAVYTWPLYVYRDLKKLEVRNKKLNPTWYDMNEERFLLDYLFS